MTGERMARMGSGLLSLSIVGLLAWTPIRWIAGSREARQTADSLSVRATASFNGRKLDWELETLKGLHFEPTSVGNKYILALISDRECPPCSKMEADLITLLEREKTEQYLDVWIVGGRPRPASDFDRISSNLTIRQLRFRDREKFRAGWPDYVPALFAIDSSFVVRRVLIGHSSTAIGEALKSGIGALRPSDDR